MQRDGRLAGAGPARNHEDAGQVGADGLVLLGLDGRDDVAHAAGAVAFERGEQGALACHFQAGGQIACWSNTSSSRPVISRPFFVIRWRRRTTPIGAMAVAR